jgi:hypothetical protein
MPSSGGDGSTPDSPAAAASKPLRDRSLFRIAVLLAVLAAAFLASRSCASKGNVTKDEAVAIAVKQKLDFKPECYQVRFGREGIQARPVWRISLWSLDANGEFDRVSIVVVDGNAGRVLQIIRRPRISFTQAQCRAPV